MAFTKAVDEFTSEYDLIQFSNHTRATTAYQKEQQLKLQDNKLREGLQEIKHMLKIFVYCQILKTPIIYISMPSEIYCFYIF